MQELLLSRNPRIRCGHTEVSFNSVDWLWIQEIQEIQPCIRSREEREEGIPRLRPMWVFMPASLPVFTIIPYRIRKLGRERKIPYETLVLTTEWLKSSLPRDRLHGFLGLSHDWVRDYVKPSYTDLDTKVFTGATAFYSNKGIT